MNTLQSGAYLRPAGLLGGQAARQAIGQSQAGLIAGGWAAFTLVEIIQRKGNQVTRSWHPYSDLDKSSDRAITGLLDQISRPRPPVAGLSMSEPQVMGIVNVTPDSFSDGGEFLRSDTAIAHARQMLHDGATILDIGGESTRPGAQPVSNSQETNRVMPVIEGLADLEAVLSVDTRKPHVMEKAAAAGADFINDVTALTFSPDALPTASRLKLPVCLMHAQGTPENMQDNPQYDNVVLDVYDYLAERITACVKAGISLEKIVIDPGIGFGKTVGHNLALIDQIAMFHGLGVPVLLGASRKSFIGAIINNPETSQRLPGSLAVALAAIRSGVQILRAHDVAETVQAIKIWQASENSPQF